ncbi:MAG: hypothetical protein ACJ70W_06695, partial [Nitrososphaera sp.]
IVIIIAAAIHKRKPKSPQAIITSLTQMSSKGNSNNTATATDTTRQQNEESFTQRKNPQIESELIEVRTTTKATTAAATIISNNITNKDKDIAPPVTPIVVPYSKEPSSSPPSTEKNVILSSSQTSQVEEISVSDEARMAGESLKDLIVEAIKDAKDSAKETGKRLKEQTVDIAATTDSRDIQSLKDYTNTLVRLFETMMIEIRKESYDKQIKLLESYRDILQLQSKVVNARGRMASKLKTGS